MRTRSLSAKGQAWVWIRMYHTEEVGVNASFDALCLGAVYSHIHTVLWCVQAINMPADPVQATTATDTSKKQETARKRITRAPGFVLCDSDCTCGILQARVCIV